MLPILGFCAGAQKNMAAKFKGRAKKLAKLIRQRDFSRQMKNYTIPVSPWNKNFLPLEYKKSPGIPNSAENR